MALTSAEQAAVNRSQTVKPADYDGNGYETLFPGGLNDMSLMVPAVAREAAAAVAAGSQAASGAATVVAKAAEVASNAAAAKASAESAAALAASLEIDPVRRTAVPAILDVRATPETALSEFAFSRPTSATRINRLGKQESVSSGVMRHSYEAATGAYRGVLIEGGRTNYFLYSNALDNTAGWARGSLGAVTPNTGRGPDGALSLDKIVPSTDTGLHNLVGVTRTVDENTRVSAQFVASPAGYSRILAQVRNRAGIYEGVVFNLANGTASVGGNFAIDYLMVSQPSGGYRCEMTWNVGAGSALTVFTVEFFVVDNSGRVSFSGDGVSGVYMGFCQFEDGTPSSYIETAGASVTRAADILTRPIGNDWNPAEGTVLVRGRIGAPNTQFEKLWMVDDETYSRRIEVYRNGSNRNIALYVEAPSGVQAEIILGALADNADFALAVAWAQNSFAASLNGQAAIVSGSGNVPQGLTKERLGCDIGGGAMSGHILQFARWPRRLSNADLQAITRRAA